MHCKQENQASKSNVIGDPNWKQLLTIELTLFYGIVCNKIMEKTDNEENDGTIELKAIIMV